MEQHSTKSPGLRMSAILEDSANYPESRSQELSSCRSDGVALSEQQKLRLVLNWAEGFLHNRSAVSPGLRLISTDSRQREAGNRFARWEQPRAPSLLHTANEIPRSESYDSRARQTVASEAEEWRSVFNASKRGLGHSICTDGNSRAGVVKKAQDEAESRDIKDRYQIVNGKHAETQKEEDDTTDTMTNRGIHTEDCRSSQQMKCSVTFPHQLTVYEQYQLCVSQLHHHRRRQSPVLHAARQVKSPRSDQNTENETCSMDPRSVHTHNKQKGCSKEKQQTLNQHGFSECGTTASIKAERGNACSKEPASEDPGKRSVANRAVDGNTLDDDWRPKWDRDGWTAEDRAAAGPTTPGSLHGLTKGSSFPFKGETEVDPRFQSLKDNADESDESLPSFQRTGKSTKGLNGLVCAHNNTSAPHDAHSVQQHVEINSSLCKAPLGCFVPENNNDAKHEPWSFPVCGLWLCLPDEMWLSILSLLSLGDLSRVTRVCRRLHTLAKDHTLWKHVRVENSNITEQWLRCLGQRLPHGLCLYRCKGPALSAGALEEFFTLCRTSLKEIRLIGCTRSGLHGDQVLSVVGQLCHSVSSVDVSWSGATDRGVQALSDCSTRFRLRCLALNGCQVTDLPLKALIEKHRESLIRLEVFGCQFITPALLHYVYKKCPGLQHLNIGQVPKVTTPCLTEMNTQLKSLVSVNLTGLQSVSDASVESLLQNCFDLQSLTLSSCLGVTDLSLHNISRKKPSLRCLDVSGCTAVSDDGVRSLALGCRRLQQLDLSSTDTRNRGVSLLATHCHAHLQAVKLNFCRITSEAILKLCKSCKRLKALHLYGCSQLPTETEIMEANSRVRVHPLQTPANTSHQ